MFKKFIRYYKPYGFLFWTDIFCAIVVAAIDLAFPQLLRFVTSLVAAGNIGALLSSLWLILVGLLAAYIIRFGCNYFIASWGHIMGARMEGDMRRQLFLHYQKLSFSYYDKNNTGEMVSKLVGDLFDISELAHHGPENLIISLLKIIGSFILLVTINLPMTMILLAVTALMFIFTVVQNRKMHKIFTDNRRKIAGVNARVQDSLLGIKVVKSFANEEVEHAKFDRSNDDFLQTKALSYKALGSFHALNSLLQGFLYISAMVGGAYFLSKGKITPVEFAMYFIYIGIFINPIEILINFTESFQRGFSGFKRFVEVIETIPEVYESKGAKTLQGDSFDIAFNDVYFSYTEGIPVLNGVSFSVKSGSTAALVGPSGGGKSTICSLLPRFYDVSSGQITINGMPASDFTLKSLRQNIGIVQQDVYIFGGTVRENIAYGKHGALDEEIIAAAKSANIHDFITELPNGYDTYVGERGALLSGGQKQRISIARVFLKDPKILILDEATSSLDNESEKHIQSALDKLSKGRTTIVIAHRLSTVRGANEIFVVDDGAIKESGSHKKLLKQGGLYAKYYNMQFEGLDD